MSSSLPYSPSPSSFPPPKSPWFPATPGTPGYPGTPSFMGPRTPVSPEQLLPRNSPQTPRTPARLAWPTENYSDVESEVGDSAPHSVSSTVCDLESLTFHSADNSENRNNTEAAAPSDDKVRDPVFAQPSIPAPVSVQSEYVPPTTWCVSESVQSSGDGVGDTPKYGTGHNGSLTLALPELGLDHSDFDFQDENVQLDWTDFVNIYLNDPSRSPNRSPFMSPAGGKAPFTPNGPPHPCLEAHQPSLPFSSNSGQAGTVYPPRPFMSLDGFRCKTKAWLDAVKANDITRSTRFLFSDLFTIEEIKTSSRRGKGGSDQLDSRRLTAIMRGVSWILNSHRQVQWSGDPWVYNYLEYVPPLSALEVTSVEKVFCQYRYQLSLQAEATKRLGLGGVSVTRKRKAPSTVI